MVNTNTLIELVSFSTSELSPGMRSIVTSIFFMNESRKERIFHRVSWLESDVSACRCGLHLYEQFLR